MALPKYKTSRANTHSRRANWKAKAAQTVICPNCGAPVPHLARLDHGADRRNQPPLGDYARIRCLRSNETRDWSPRHVRNG